MYLMMIDHAPSCCKEREMLLLGSAELMIPGGVKATCDP